MAGISGYTTAFYLYDVAEDIDLSAVSSSLGAVMVPARLAPKHSAPAYVQFKDPPLQFEGSAIELSPSEAFRVRFKFYSYGVVSLALTRSFSGGWEDLVSEGQRLVDHDGLALRAEQECRALVDRVEAAMTGRRSSFLSEDYLVFTVTDIGETTTADELIARRGDAIARLLRGETEPLSRQEIDEVLRHRVSYLASDLVVPTWNTAFVFDTDAGARASLEIVEFANSQLLQFRYYDDLLDHELAGIYGDLQKPRWYDALAGRRYTRAAHQLHSLFIDVNEITDKTENALKMVGDVYAARLFGLVAARLGLDQWKRNVQDKLKTLDDIYRFAVQQTGMSRGEFLELTIIAILVLELVLFFMGIMT